MLVLLFAVCDPSEKLHILSVPVTLTMKESHMFITGTTISHEKFSGPCLTLADTEQTLAPITSMCRTETASSSKCVREAKYSNFYSEIAGPVHASRGEDNGSH
jgi:hypothetical protein